MAKNKKKYYSEIEPGSKLTTVFDFNSSTVPSNFSNTRALELANQNGNPNEFVFNATTDVANSRQALNVVAPINGNYTPRNHLFVTGSPGVEQGMKRHAYQEYDPRGVLVAKMTDWEPYVRPEIEGGIMFTKKYDPYVDRTSGFTAKNSSYEAGLGYYGGSFAPYVKLNPTLTYRMRPDSWQPEPPQKIDESDLYLARYMRDHPGYDNVGMFKPVGIDVSGDLDIRNTIPAGGDEATLYDYNRMGNAWNTGAEHVGANIGAKLLTASGINPYVKFGVNYNPELTQKLVPSATIGVNSVITNKGNKRRYIPVQHKYGGPLNKYEKGNTVYVSSATDPRYKRYKDSLDLYNYYKLQTQLENPSGGRMPGAGQGHEYSSFGDFMNTLAETGNTVYNMYAKLPFIPLTDEEKKNDEYLFKVASDIIKNNPDLTWGTDFPDIFPGEEDYKAYKNAKTHSSDIKTKDGSIRATGSWMGYARNNNYANTQPTQTVVVAPPMSLKKGDVYKTQYGEYEIVSNPTPGAGVKLKNKKTGQESEVNYQDMASHVYNKDASVSTPTQKKTLPPAVKKTTTTTTTAATPTQQAEAETKTTTTTPSTQTTQTVKKTTAPFKPKTGGFYAEDGTYWRFDEKGNLVPAAKNTNQGYKYGGKTWLDNYK